MKSEELKKALFSCGVIVVGPAIWFGMRFINPEWLDHKFIMLFLLLIATLLFTVIWALSQICLVFAKQMVNWLRSFDSFFHLEKNMKRKAAFRRSLQEIEKDYNKEFERFEQLKNEVEEEFDNFFRTGP